MEPRWFVLNINPEPWAVGDAFVGRRGGSTFARVGPNPNLVAYQAAIREELADEEILPYSYQKFTFYFWRQRAQYLDAADHRRTRNAADATNMQKALEDALQGILYENDRDNRDVRSVIVQQGIEVQPRIAIKCEMADPFVTGELPDEILDQINQPSVLEVSDNSWPPKNREKP